MPPLRARAADKLVVPTDKDTEPRAKGRNESKQNAAADAIEVEVGGAAPSAPPFAGDNQKRGMRPKTPKMSPQHV